jgi:chitinase
MATDSSRESEDWVDLNECPLHACCNIWGQCGVTSEFCTISPSKTGNPGTAAPRSNGCVSNCGTEIIIGPAGKFKHVGYYEAYHINRPCNFMSVSDIPNVYTKVHWAFGGITTDFSATTTPYKADWKDSKASTRFKRIISFGSWAFSTELSSYYIFLEGVKLKNRQRFAQNMIDFVKSEGQDGINIDWEYPRAPND